ncbi:MAG: hypothetical protein K2M95_00015 [Clostridiales bacterium]|nr:hypothetical protein [Clostridiales bacterium]
MKKLEIFIKDENDVKATSVLKDIDLSELSVKYEKRSGYVLIDGNKQSLSAFAHLLFTIAENETDENLSLHLDALTPTSFGQLSEDSTSVVITKG